MKNHQAVFSFLKPVKTIDFFCADPGCK